MSHGLYWLNRVHATILLRIPVHNAVVDGDGDGDGDGGGDFLLWW